MCWWWNLNGKFSQTSQRRRRNDLGRITRFFTWRLACFRRLYARAGRVQKRGTRSTRAGWRTSAQKIKNKKNTFWLLRKWDFSPETAEFLLSAQHDANISDGLNLHAHFALEHLKPFDPDQRAPAGSKRKDDRTDLPHEFCSVQILFGRRQHSPVCVRARSLLGF